MFEIENDENLLRIDGRIFINRDPDDFRLLIKHLRHNRELEETPQLIQELFYWNLPIQYLDKIKSVLFEIPNEIDDSVRNRLRDLGPVDVQELVRQNKIEYNRQNPIKRLAGRDKYDFYVGQVNGQNQYHGVGRYYDHYDKVLYDGNFSNGVINGFGREIEFTGYYYEGFFEADRRHGEGRMVSSDGLVQEGTWEKGLF